MGNGGLHKKRGNELSRVKLVKSRERICNMIARMTEFFFKNDIEFPFRGFLLEGPPATGKTEIAKQVARIVDEQFKEGNVYLTFVDSSDIAASKWGEAEERLRAVFEEPEDSEKDSEKKIILIDDIDCLMIKRGEPIAKEWHYSVNSVLFHILDELQPHNALVIATTNRPDLIDDALRSRLYPINTPDLNKDELIKVARDILSKIIQDEAECRIIMKIIEEKIKMTENITLRGVQQMVTKEFIERRFGI